VTRWIDLATSAKLLGVNEEESAALLECARVPFRDDIPVRWNDHSGGDAYGGGDSVLIVRSGYNAAAVEELRRLMDRQKDEIR
jgi:hypothetical protein